MTTEALIERPPSLTEQCAALIPAFWSSEVSLLIADAEPSELQVVDTKIAEWLAADLAKDALSKIDPLSERGCKLVAFIEALAVDDDFQWPAVNMPDLETETPVGLPIPARLSNPEVRLAWPSDAGLIHKIAISRAKSMAPGLAYAEHAAANQQRIESSGLSGVRNLIERSESEPGKQLAIVAHLGNIATASEGYHELTGYMFARRELSGADYFTREHILIHGIAVDEYQMQRGIGKTLLGFIDVWQEAMSMELPICAQVADTNVPMIHMLERYSFNRHGTVEPTASNPVRYAVLVREKPRSSLDTTGRSIF
jgi:hypothetical protein